MWPFKKKIKKPIVTPEEVFDFLKKAQKRPPCPDKQLLSQNCVCADCPKSFNCPMEAVCRSTGCESNILTCSLKTHLTKGNGSVSEFGDVVMAVSIRRVLREMSDPNEQSKIHKEMKGRKEREDGEKERSKRALDDEGPWVLG